MKNLVKISLISMLGVIGLSSCGSSGTGNGGDTPAGGSHSVPTHFQPSTPTTLHDGVKISQPFGGSKLVMLNGSANKVVRKITIQNNFSYPTTLTSALVSTSSKATFKGGTCHANMALGAGAACTIDLIQGVDSGDFSLSVNYAQDALPSDSKTAKITYELSAQGLTVSPHDSVVFEDGKTGSFKFTNNTAQSTSALKTDISGGEGDISIKKSSDCRGAVLKPGDSCTVTVTGSGAAVGTSLKASLEVSDVGGTLQPASYGVVDQGDAALTASMPTPFLLQMANQNPSTTAIHLGYGAGAVKFQPVLTQVNFGSGSAVKVGSGASACVIGKPVPATGCNVYAEFDKQSPVKPESAAVGEYHLTLTTQSGGTSASKVYSGGFEEMYSNFIGLTDSHSSIGLAFVNQSKTAVYSQPGLLTLIEKAHPIPGIERLSIKKMQYSVERNTVLIVSQVFSTGSHPNVLNTYVDTYDFNTNTYTALKSYSGDRVVVLDQARDGAFATVGSGSMSVTKKGASGGVTSTTYQLKDAPKILGAFNGDKAVFTNGDVYTLSGGAATLSKQLSMPSSSNSSMTMALSDDNQYLSVSGLSDGEHALYVYSTLPNLKAGSIWKEGSVSSNSVLIPGSTAGMDALTVGMVDVNKVQKLLTVTFENGKYVSEKQPDVPHAVKYLSRMYGNSNDAVVELADGSFIDTNYNTTYSPVSSEVTDSKMWSSFNLFPS